MSRVFFASELEGVVTFWRIYRRDGVMQAFTGHDRNLWFDGILHRAAPGMVPSAIRRTARLEADSADVRGALTHDAISAADLSAGLYDGAGIAIGLVDWETREAAVLYRGEIGAISEEDGAFQAQLESAKVELQRDLTPRTSPTCRAQFCGPGCNLSIARHTHELLLSAVDFDSSLVSFAGMGAASLFADGSLRWVDGPHVGVTMEIVRADASGLLLDRPLDEGLAIGARALLREGCDHTFATCSARFGNGANFRGEPFLPGNDLLSRYPTSAN